MTLIELSTKRPVTIMMFTVALLLFGMVSLSRLSLDLLPELAYPTLTVRSIYEGAAPAEVEQLVSKPIEEALGMVKNVRRLRSISSAGRSDVILEFTWGTDMDLASMDVREKLDLLALPLDIKRPVLLRFNPAMDPIMRLGLTWQEAQQSAGLSSESALKQLREYGEEQLKRKLESLEGIAAVKVSGGLENQVQIDIDQQRIAQLNLSISQISQQLAAENVNLAGGRLQQGTEQYLVRTLNQYQSLDEMANTLVTTPAGQSIRLADFATVSFGSKERQSINRINGQEAVEIAIYKEGDANTVAIARAISHRLQGLQKDLPKGFELIKIHDRSEFITQAINEVQSAAVIGGLLAMAVLYLFLRNAWSTFIISLSIPVSVISSFSLMHANDISLNMMSLGGIALAVGLLVDNAIVVLENIARLRERGLGLLAAARQGSHEVSAAITASTLTTVAVFLPLAFVEGIAGQLFRDQALTVTFALLISLLVAMTLIPMLSARTGHSHANDDQTPINPASAPQQKANSKWLLLLLPFQLLFKTLPSALLALVFIMLNLLAKALKWLLAPLLNVFDRVYQQMFRQYLGSLKWALQARIRVLLIAFGVFGGAIWLLPQLGLELIPRLSQGEFKVEFLLPPGTPLSQTDKILSAAQQKAAAIDSIERSFAVAGSGNSMAAATAQRGQHWGELNLVMQKNAGRAMEQQAMRQLRMGLSHIPGVQIKLSRPALFSFDTPLEVEIAGFDLVQLRKVSEALVEKMQQNPRFADIKSSMTLGQPEIRIHFDQARLTTLGLNIPDLAQRVVDKLKGSVATRYAWRDRKIDVLVRVKENQRTSVAAIKALIVNPSAQRPVPLSAVATITVATAPSEIHRIDQQRIALVSANISFGDLAQAAEEVQTLIDNISLPNNMGVRVTGQNEEMNNSFKSLLLALALAIFLVYVVMASQFESLLHPFIILFSVPLALAGSVFALYFTGQHISVVVFIGLIMLAGIVVNNAIVLVDRINFLRAAGMEKASAIVEAGANRLRPIIMTTLTTILGLLPLALGVGEGSELRTPLAVTVIGGLLLSTLLTLILIPVLYSLVDRKTYSTVVKGAQAVVKDAQAVVKGVQAAVKEDELGAKQV